MTKKELIESIAYVDCAGDVLIQRDIPALGISISDVSQSGKGLRILGAQQFAGFLTEVTQELPDKVNAILLRVLHSASAQFHAMEISALTIPGLEQEIIVTHQKMVSRLRQVSVELGIHYDEPIDPLIEEDLE